MTGEDLDPIFERVRETPPAGLEERLLAGLRDPDLARSLERADRADAIHAAIRISGLVLVLAAIALAVALWLDLRTDVDGAPANGVPATRSTIESEILALSTPLDPRTTIWPLEVK